MNGMPLPRRPLMGLASAFLAVSRARAADQPVRFIVPFAPGGTTDQAARIVRPKMQDLLGQPVVIDNRTGAAGNVGMETVLRAPADGNTILLGDVGAMTINAAIYPELRFKPLEEFKPLSVVTHTPSLLVVGPTFPPRTVRELVEYVKARPDAVSFASQGNGSQNRLAMEIFAEKEGLRMIHVPYRGGSGPAALDIMGGHVPMMFAGLPPVIGNVQAGRMRVLAVATEQRHPLLPDVPTFVESGRPDMVMSSWQGIFVRTSTPAPIHRRLTEALAETMADPEVQQRCREAGLTPTCPTPEEATRFILAEEARWSRVARAVGASGD